MSFFSRSGWIAAALLAAALAAGPAQARDAAFVDPGSMGGNGEEAVKVDPKPDIDMGETALNVAKRTTIFFVNQTNMPVTIEKITLNGDSSISSEITANDCLKQGTLAAGNRCSVEISVTPTSPGTWSLDVLMTHNGAGRLTRAHVTGKTAGSGASEHKETGLAVSSHDIKPVDFGTVTVGDGKIVRSTLMVNDSAEPITIYAIDVIEADNGLQRLDQGCAVDMELAPGASCPVTLLWVPAKPGPISTDLIIRHSGQLGFAVIPIRGEAKDADAGKTDQADSMKKPGGLPPPPGADQLAREMAGKVAPVSSAALAPPHAEAPSGGDGHLHLIGTVGDRAVLLLPSGETAVVAAGGEFADGSGEGRLVRVNGRSADVEIGGRKKTLPLEAAQSIIDQASAEQEQEEQQQENGGGKGKGGRKDSQSIFGGR